MFLEPTAFLAAIVEHSHDAIFGKTLDSTITSWNRAAEKLYGDSASEAIGPPVSLLVPEDRQDEVAEIMDRVQCGEALEHYETMRKRKDGTLVAVSLTISPVCDKDGAIVGASTIARDISSKREAEEALRGAEKLASMGRMAATLVHEISNPLEAASNIAFLLKSSTALDDGTKELVMLLERELKHISGICHRTHSFARQGDTATSVAIADLFDEVTAMLSKALREKKIVVAREFESRGELLGYAGPLRQLCMNLVSNAIDAIRADAAGRIVIRIRRRNWLGTSGVRFTIRDNGQGIASKHRAKIFKPFFSTKEENGTGLGLWVSHGVVTRHGGVIRVRSSVRGGHSGTCFTVFIPDQTTVTSENQLSPRQPRYPRAS